MNAVDIYFKCYFVSNTQTFPRICHKVGVAIKNVQVKSLSLILLSKLGETFSSLIKTLENIIGNRLGGVIICISPSIKNTSSCLVTFVTPVCVGRKEIK